MFLKGQQYSFAEEDADWPNSKFEIVRSVKHELWIGNFCSGVKLEPLKIIQSAECKDDIIWSEHEDLMKGSPETFAKTLLKSLKAELNPK